MDDLHRDELLSAYIDGELNAAERSHVERLLAHSAEARQIVDELRALRGVFAAFPRHQLETGFAEQVLRQAERTMLLGPLVDGSQVVSLPAGKGAQHQPQAHTESSRNHSSESTASDAAPSPESLSNWNKLIAAVGAVAGLAAAVLIMASLTGPEPERQIAQNARSEEESRLGRRDLAERAEPALPDASKFARDGAAGLSTGDADVSNLGDQPDDAMRGALGFGTSSGVAISGYGTAPDLAAQDSSGRFIKLDAAGSQPDVAYQYYDFSQSQIQDTESFALAGRYGMQPVDQVVVVRLNQNALDANTVLLEQTLAKNNINLATIENSPAEDRAARGPVAQEKLKLDSSESTADRLETVNEPAIASRVDRSDPAAEAKAGEVPPQHVYFVEAPSSQIEATLAELKAESQQLVSVDVYPAEQLERQSQVGQDRQWRMNLQRNLPRSGGVTELQDLYGRGLYKKEASQATDSPVDAKQMDAFDPQPAGAAGGRSKLNFKNEADEAETLDKTRGRVWADETPTPEGAPLRTPALQPAPTDSRFAETLGTQLGLESRSRRMAVRSGQRPAGMSTTAGIRASGGEPPPAPAPSRTEAAPLAASAAPKAMRDLNQLGGAKRERMAEREIDNPRPEIGGLAEQARDESGAANQQRVLFLFEVVDDASISAGNEPAVPAPTTEPAAEAAPSASPDSK